MANEECLELKNIKYKTMLLNKNKKTFVDSTNNVCNLDILLDKECNLNKKESWNKLDKSIKMDKINEYIELLTVKHKLTMIEQKTLNEYLSISLDKKNLYKNKDVVYIRESGKLENIPILHFNNNTRKFTIKKQQQQSTAKGLGPTRKVNRSKSNKNNVIALDTQKSLKLPKSPKSHKNTKNTKIA